MAEEGLGGTAAPAPEGTPDGRLAVLTGPDGSVLGPTAP